MIKCMPGVIDVVCASHPRHCRRALRRWHSARWLRPTRALSAALSESRSNEITHTLMRGHEERRGTSCSLLLFEVNNCSAYFCIYVWCVWCIVYGVWCVV